MDGNWTIGTNQTTKLPLALPQTIAIVTDGSSAISLFRQWTDTSKALIKQDMVKAAVGRTACTTMSSRVYALNVFMGVEYDTKSPVCGASMVLSEAHASFSTTAVLAASTRSFPSTEHHTLILTGDNLTYTLFSELPAVNVTFWFQRTASIQTSKLEQPAKAATNDPVPAVVDASAAFSNEPALGAATSYNLDLADSWNLIEPDFQTNAMLIALQGLVNRQEPVLYLTYPSDWAYTYTPMVRNFFEHDRGIPFSNLTGPQEALGKLGGVGRGVVLWDPLVRESLVVAFTVAGVEDALVITEAQLPLVRAAGANTTIIANLTGVFRNMSAVDIYTWAWEHYGGDRVSQEYIVWMGGSCPTSMHPGIADWGVSRRAFFNDLSTAPDAPGGEYQLANKLVASLGDEPLLMGWHSYCKDEEHTFTTLASSHGGRVHGLNTNPNLSFSNRVELPAGYQFKNHFTAHTPEPESVQDKVVIGLVQTDGLGLGAWVQPGRGTIPYGWEVTLPDLWLQPSLLQMFYEQATDKDFFVGALGGPGYMYPKAVPKALLPSRLQQAQAAMATLDLKHFVIFDASQVVGAHSVTSDTTLTPEVVDAYFAADTMNETLGFLNGYGPTFTFQHRASPANRSLVSFDYYLDPGRSVAAAISDLESLAKANTVRPYFLAVHVREFSTVGKVQEIIAGLPADAFTVQPIDSFFELANANPTWLDRYETSP
jgi:hypothetical protein